MSKFVSALAALTAVGMITAGCGGSNNSTSTTALTKAQFDSQANAICKKGNQEINKAANATFKSGKPSSADLNKFATDTVIPSTQSQINQISDLTPPSGDEDQVNAILAAANKALDEVKKDPSLVTQQGGQDPFAETNKLANAYGLTTCASGG